MVKNLQSFGTEEGVVKEMITLKNEQVTGKPNGSPTPAPSSSILTKTSYEIIGEQFKYTREELKATKWVLLSDYEKEIVALNGRLDYEIRLHDKALSELVRLEEENKKYEVLFSLILADDDNFKVMNKPSPEQVRRFVRELIRKNVALLDDNKRLRRKLLSVPNDSSGEEGDGCR